MRVLEDVSSNSILKRIIRDQLGDAHQYTYVILGDGPCTGKTWLCNELKCHGFNAVEISEHICGLVTYKDKRNYCIVDDINKQMTIVLNQRYTFVH